MKRTITLNVSVLSFVKFIGFEQKSSTSITVYTSIKQKLMQNRYFNREFLLLFYQ
jgi:hypothetical protein